MRGGCDWLEGLKIELRWVAEALGSEGGDGGSEAAAAEGEASAAGGITQGREVESFVVVCTEERDGRKN